MVDLSLTPISRFLPARLFPCLACTVVALAASPVLKAQSGPPPLVWSANNSADYSTTIAQGSIIVLFGLNLGPSLLQSVTSFPLPPVLAGTSVTVTSGSTKLTCPMVYTSALQVAAILPSNTPVGPVNITVAVNGLTDGVYSTAQAMVVANSPGLYTTTSTGLGAGIFTTYLDGSLKTLTNAAKPGELVYVWATGLGPISTPDDVLPPSFPNFPNVQVFVDGQAAQVVYGGRSGCCSGLDQIAFYVPAVAAGCNVPVTVASVGSPSNTVTMPVGASGGPCSDSGPTLPTSILTKAAAGQPVKLGIVAVGPGSILGLGLEPRALAQRLSAALHAFVSEADAARLIRAYRTRNPRAIRAAMGKYAVQWKALDAQTRARLTAQVSQTQDGVIAEFGTLSSDSVVAAVASALFPPVGGCVILPNSFPYELGLTGAGLDLGASLALTGAAGSLTLTPVANGRYQTSFNAPAAGPNIPLGAYTISGTGGKDAGAFSATVNVGGHLAISNKSSLASINLTQPLTVTWTGGVAGNYVLVGGGSTHDPHSYFACAEDAGRGTFTVPTFILSSINATAEGIVWIAPNPLSNQITIPGVDLAYFADVSNDSVNAAFVNPPNVTNVAASIDGLYPASGAAAAQNGGMSTSGPVSFSALLTAGTFTAAFDILPNANPFTVEAVCPAGSATIQINPAQDTWQATYIVPTAAARLWDFSGDGFVVADFLSSGLDFPNNIIPLSRVDPLAASALNALPYPNVTGAGGANGTWSASGTLPAGGHFMIGTGTNPPPNFGGFINLTARGAQSANFSLYVDGKLVASKQVPFTTD